MRWLVILLHGSMAVFYSTKMTIPSIALVGFQLAPDL